MPESLVPTGTSRAPLYDWSVEVPEWRASPPGPAKPTSSHRPAVDHGLPDLTAAVPTRHGITGAAQRRRAGLTRRGRAVAATGVALVSLVGAALLAVSLAESAPVSATTEAPTTTEDPTADSDTPEAVTVEPGDTLWDIAERIRPNVDPRRTIHELVELNELSESALRPGQRIDLPEL